MWDKYLPFVIFGILAVLAGGGVFFSSERGIEQLGAGPRIFMPVQGGTGTATVPATGEVLVGQSDGTYEPAATSTLNISATPAGNNTEVQFNNSGAFGASSAFTFNNSLSKLTVTNASTTNLSVTGLSSALLSADASGIVGEYAGTSCTNQFPRSLSALGAATCASVSLSADVTGTLGIANGGTNATSFTTTNGVVHYNGTSLITDSDFTYNGSILAAGDGTGTSTISGNLDVDGDIEANTFYAIVKIINQGDVTASYYTATSTTATSTFPNLKITQAFHFFSEIWYSLADFITYIEGAIDTLSNLTTLELPNSASPTVDAVGEVALDTTSNNLVAFDGTNTFVFGQATSSLASFAIASTSPEAISGGIKDIPKHRTQARTAIAVNCWVEAGTSQQIFLSDGTNDTNTITCTTTPAQYELTSNNSWTAGESWRVELATKSGTWDYVNVEILGRITTD